MGLSRFFKTPSHQRFEYTPRHWDPKKEDLEKRLENAMKKKGNDPEGMKARISTGMRRGARGGRSMKGASTYRSNLLLLGIIIVLVAITYLLFVQYLPFVLNSIGIEAPPK